jgi:hypothetical protein
MGNTWLIPVLGGLLGFCFSQAYLTGPGKHRREVMQEALALGYAEKAPDGSIVFKIPTSMPKLVSHE